MVQNLNLAHKKHFSLASKKIKKHQARYKRRYDLKHNVRPLTFRVGDKVQREFTTNRNRMGGKLDLSFAPHNGYYVIHKISKNKKKIILKNPKTKRILTKRYPSRFIRPYYGK